MSRDPYVTVTGFALLIPASASQAMGEALFLWGGDSCEHVRAIKLDEIREAARKLRGTEAARFDALLSFRDAEQSRDQLAKERASERGERFYRLLHADRGLHCQGSSANRNGWAWFAEIFYEHRVEQLRRGDGVDEDPGRFLAYEASKAVGDPQQDARIVLWRMDGAIRPAIYCKSVTTALYIHTFFLAPMGERGFRICPYDGEQFFQKQRNQVYCCPAHREAHRVARHRDKERREAEAEKKGKDGESGGTDKTR